MDENTEVLTQDAFERLQADLKYRSTELREEITKRIEVARAHGDLKENAEYHAAKDEQGLNEDRIRQIETRLRNATISEVDVASGEVAVGMIVTIDDDGDIEELFVGSMEDRPEGGVDVVGQTSPMGRALLGGKVGDTVSYVGPTGATFDVTIKEVRAP
ncbi:transcription elongation factor GreA [Euzebya tangerina]|uniref:transcription elongation factor GreA n=1 Tax=Euzebya tangerina TaxID=591198 RepID=UPI000E30D262|nr:transcription elongation factor GreA [Euzebya tangerina]